MLPPVLAIALAIWTRRVFAALALFIFAGWTVMSDYNPVLGLVRSVDAVVVVFTNADNVRVLLFSCLIGAVISLTQVSGGVRGFLRWAEGLGLARHPRRLQFFTMFVSGTIFIESWFGLLVSGAIARPLFDKCKISREKLSYLLDVTCAPKCILLALNAWGAYVVSLLSAQGYDQPVGVFVGSIPFNFYPMAALVVAVVVVVFDWNIGPMRQAEQRLRSGGPLVREGSLPMVARELTEQEPPAGTPLRAMNMLIPLLAMVATVPTVLWITGKGNLAAGSGSQSLFWAGLMGVGLALVAYRLQRLLNGEQLAAALTKGVQGLLPLVTILVLAFTIGATARALGIGEYVSQLAKANLPTFAVPAVVFLLGCFIAFSTGTSWGTFAIMVPIVVPMIRVLNLHQGLALGSALGGGIFGDHCSPISDSTIISSMASATDHIDHVRTQIPYALISATIALTLILTVGALLQASP